MLIFKYLLTALILIAPISYLLIILLKFKQELKESKFIILFFLLLTTLFFNKLLFFDQTLAQKDFNDIQVPFFHFFQTSIKESFLPPLWNTNFCGGFDNFADPLAGYFSVFNFVFIFFENIYLAFNVYIFLQVLFCLIISYLFFRTLDFKKHSSFLGSIVLTFNAFLVMRLSPGVGIEYLFTYKWIPLILALFLKYIEVPNLRNILYLSIPVAFLLEGNPNIAISIALLGFVFSLFYVKKIKPNILLLPIFSFFIFAVKLLPTLPLYFTNNLDFEYQYGWRSSNYDFDMFPEIFFPFRVDFLNGYFTPGIIAIVLFIVCIVVLLAKRDLMSENTSVKAFTLIFTLGFLLTIEESPIYKLLYSLPVFDKVTIIPAFTIFYIIPIAFFVAFFAQTVLKEYPKITYLLGILVFLEVLMGPSTFGKATYSFNFAKMNYKTEPYDFSYYQALSELDQGTFFIKDKPDIFMYPYSVAIYDLQSLNKPAYFSSCTDEKDYSQSADYILTLSPIENKEFELVEQLKTTNLLDHKSHSVFEHKADYLALYETGWNNEIYIYENNFKTQEEQNETTNADYISSPIVVGFTISSLWFLYVLNWLYRSRSEK